MTNKPMLSVERELIQRIADHCKFWVDHPYLEAIADVEVELRALLSRSEVWVPCSPELLESGVDCATSPRWSSKEWDGHSHWHPAPIADHTQCEECKGWGYHENHHEGDGTECGECGGSGNAPVAVVMPERMKTEPFTTIDRGSKNYKAGYNAAIAEIAKLNGIKP